VAGAQDPGQPGPGGPPARTAPSGALELTGYAEMGQRSLGRPCPPRSFRRRNPAARRAR
jgi:hypothetical protein